MDDHGLGWYDVPRIANEVKVNSVTTPSQIAHTRNVMHRLAPAQV